LLAAVGFLRLSAVVGLDFSDWATNNSEGLVGFSFMCWFLTEKELADEDEGTLT
jgi:hypothetical protein